MGIEMTTNCSEGTLSLTLSKLYYPLSKYIEKALIREVLQPKHEGIWHTCSLLPQRRAKH